MHHICSHFCTNTSSVSRFSPTQTAFGARNILIDKVRVPVVSARRCRLVLVTHSGGDLGFITDLAMLPDRKIAVIWMANCDWIDAGPINGPITYAALDVALGLQPAPITLKRSLARTLYFTYQQEGIATALREYQTLKKRHPGLYDFREGQLDELGTRLLSDGHPKEAIKVLRLNATAYPSSIHARRQLVEAYGGDRDSSATTTKKP